jgi:RNA polymerase sigma factor (TIGR02999 family)
MADEAPSPTFTLLADPQLTAAERAARLLPLVYDQLRAAARHTLRGERAGHTLQPTALVHEAFLKLVGPRDVPWQSRAHFFHAAAAAMRQIVVDHARAKATQRRGGPDARRAAIELHQLPAPSSAEQAAGFLELDAALVRLERVDPAVAAVVQLRYFAGLTVDETAQALGQSAPTVKRAWAFARAWLRSALDGEPDDG